MEEILEELKPIDEFDLEEIDSDNEPLTESKTREIEASNRVINSMIEENEKLIAEGDDVAIRRLLVEGLKQELRTIEKTED